MSDPVNVSPSDLRRAADRLDALADALDSGLLPLRAATRAAVDGNPGWATSAALGATECAWRDALSGTARELRAHGDRLRAVADGYEAADHRAAERLGEAARSRPVPAATTPPTRPGRGPW
ncbi:MAG TPA: type VII secretion target [Micromonosporaceae bacterium]